jgi:hypothetical protein
VPSTTLQISLLDELEARQDDVLRQLADLNDRLEKTLAEFAPTSKAEPNPAGLAVSSARG